MPTKKSDGKLVYLATPYTHEHKEVQEVRFHMVNWAASVLMRAGVTLFSPISHSHVIAEGHHMPTTWEFWSEQDRAILNKCDAVLVLKQDGWKESKGVKGELEIARELGLPVFYIDVEAIKLLEDCLDVVEFKGF